MRWRPTRLLVRSARISIPIQPSTLKIVASIQPERHMRMSGELRRMDRRLAPSPFRAFRRLLPTRVAHRRRVGCTASEPRNCASRRVRRVGGRGCILGARSLDNFRERPMSAPHRRRHGRAPYLPPYLPLAGRSRREAARVGEHPLSLPRTDSTRLASLATLPVKGRAARGTGKNATVNLPVLRNFAIHRESKEAKAFFAMLRVAELDSARLKCSKALSRLPRNQISPDSRA